MKTAVYIVLLLLLVPLILTPYAVSEELIYGVNKAKEFWFYGASLLIICLAFIYSTSKKMASTAYQIAIDIAPHRYYAPYLLATLHFDTDNIESAINILPDIPNKLPREGKVIR